MENMSNIKKFYSVEWSHGMAQKNLSKSEAISIARELLDKNDEVVIKKYNK